MKNLFLLFAISFLPGSVFCQQQDSLVTERNIRIEELYQGHVKRQRKEDREMILIGLAASAVGIWLVDRYDPDAPDNDDETKLAWTGLGLCVAGPIVFGYGVYSLPGEGSAKKKKDFFMRYQHYDFSSRFLPGSGFLAFGVRLKL